MVMAIERWLWLRQLLMIMMVVEGRNKTFHEFIRTEMERYESPDSYQWRKGSFVERHWALFDVNLIDAIHYTVVNWVFK